MRFAESGGTSGKLQGRGLCALPDYFRWKWCILMHFKTVFEVRWPLSSDLRRRTYHKTGAFLELTS